MTSSFCPNLSKFVSICLKLSGAVVVGYDVRFVVHESGICLINVIEFLSQFIPISVNLIQIAPGRRRWILRAFCGARVWHLLDQ